jgi:hypothetical protein
MRRAARGAAARMREVAQRLFPPEHNWMAVTPGSLLFTEVNISSDSDVLIIADSHNLISGAHQAFPGCDVSARPGRTSDEGLSVLDLTLRPRHEVVVFDLSTNDIVDPGAFAANLEVLRERIGNRGLVLVNCWRRDEGNSHRDVNGVLAEFAARHPERTTLVDWAAHVDAHAEPLGRRTDYVHFSVSAYQDRIELINAAIRESLGRAPGEGRRAARA